MSAQAARELPDPLNRRVEHVISENERVRQAAAALGADDLSTVAALLNASHASLRENYEVSTPAVEAAVDALLAAGALGARLVGGGFGGSVLGLMPPGQGTDALLLGRAREVRPGPGARLLAS